MRRLGFIAVIVALIGLSPLSAFAAGAGARSAASVIAAATKAIGAEGLSSIKLWGSGASFGIGQNNNPDGPWPRTNLNDYYRSIDFERSASKATAVTWAAPVTGGPAVQGAFNQIVTPANQAWGQQLEIWTTPWGFLKGAAQNHATVSSQVIGGRPYKVVTWMTPQTSPSGLHYKVVGYIGPTNLVEKVRTWVEHPVFGDMLVESVYSDWRDLGGLMFPSTMTQARAGHDVLEAQILGVAANPADIVKLTEASGPPPGPPPGAGAPAKGPTSEKLADGVWRINGAYNALAVEFRDYALIFEPGPQNEARAQAIIAETRRLIPGKPIRYGVITHHHIDHTGGLEAVAAEGITIVTPQINKAFLEKALGGPRTLAPDALAKSGRKPIVEGFLGDKRVFTDGTRTFEVHRIRGLPHADGLVIGWLPKEKILVYADMFNLPPASAPVPNPPVVGTQVFLANLERLKIEPERIVSIHSLSPDRLATMDDIRASLGLK